MKRLILVLILAIVLPFMLKADETNVPSVTNQVWVTNRICLVEFIYKTNYITIEKFSERFDPEKAQRLLEEIRNCGIVIRELTKELPSLFAYNFSTNSVEFAVFEKKLQKVWEQYDIALTNLVKKRLEFKNPMH
jgi:hypothetical protein